MKQFLRICSALILMMSVGQASMDGIETLDRTAMRSTREFLDLERQQQESFQDQSNYREKSQMEFRVNLVFLSVHGVISDKDFKQVLCIGTACFVSGFSILRYLGFV